MSELGAATSSNACTMSHLQDEGLVIVSQECVVLLHGAPSLVPAPLALAAARFLHTFPDTAIVHISLHALPRSAESTNMDEALQPIEETPTERVKGPIQIVRSEACTSGTHSLNDPHSNLTCPAA